MVLEQVCMCGSERGMYIAVKLSDAKYVEC